MGFNPKWLVGKVIKRVVTQRINTASDGRPPDMQTHFATIYFEDGSSLGFIGMEADYEQYVHANYFPPPKRSKRAEKKIAKELRDSDACEGDLMVEITDRAGNEINSKVFRSKDRDLADDLYDSQECAKIAKYVGWVTDRSKSWCELEKTVVEYHHG